MDDLFTIILFLIFVIAPILEQLKRKGQPPQRPPQPPRYEPSQTSTTEEVSAKSRDPATVLIPDDLWQVITGEQAPPLPAKRAPWDVVYIPPDEEAETEDVQVEATRGEDVNVELERTTWEAVSTEHGRRHLPSSEAVSLEVEPTIVSLETVPPPGVRHSAFHTKLAQAAEVREVKPPRVFTLGNRSDLQRAFIIKEVLGKPRGLE